MTPMRLAMRSLIINATLGLTAIATLARVYGVVNYVSPSGVLPLLATHASLQSADRAGGGFHGEGYVTS
jgi:hypothetical protein